MDERRGRREAERLGVQPLGLASLLIAGQRAGLLPAVKPLLDELRDTAGFRLPDEVSAEVLGRVGEWS